MINKLKKLFINYSILNNINKHTTKKPDYYHSLIYLTISVLIYNIEINIELT